VRIPTDAAGALLNQNAVKLTPEVRFDRAFLFYLLRNDNFKTYIIGTAQGAASQAAITLDAIRGYELDLPPLQVQQRIASILSAYDELIENSQRRIRLLDNYPGATANGTIFDFRILPSRVTSGTRWTMLVEAMISSAGSLLKSRSWIPRQISSVRGQVWIFDRARTTSGSVRSISTRPSWTSFEISQRTIPEMLQVSADRSLRSFGVREPWRAWMTI